MILDFHLKWAGGEKLQYLCLLAFAFKFYWTTDRVDMDIHVTLFRIRMFVRIALNSIEFVGIGSIEIKFVYYFSFGFWSELLRQSVCIFATNAEWTVMARYLARISGSSDIFGEVQGIFFLFWMNLLIVIEVYLMFRGIRERISLSSTWYLMNTTTGSKCHKKHLVLVSLQDTSLRTVTSGLAMS